MQKKGQVAGVWIRFFHHLKITLRSRSQIKEYIINSFDNAAKKATLSHTFRQPSSKAMLAHRSIYNLHWEKIIAMQ